MAHMLPWEPYKPLSLFLDVQIPPEVWCFRYAFGVQVSSLSVVFWVTLNDFYHGKSLFFKTMSTAVRTQPVKMEGQHPLNRSSFLGVPGSY